MPREERPQGLKSYNIYLEWERAGPGGWMLYGAYLSAEAVDGIFAHGFSEEEALQGLLTAYRKWQAWQQERSRTAGFLLPLQ